MLLYEITIADAKGRNWRKSIEFDVDFLKGTSTSGDYISVSGKAQVFYSLEEDSQTRCEIIYCEDFYFKNDYGLETRNQEMSYWEQGAEWLPVPDEIDRDPSFRMVPYHVLGIPV